MANRSTLLHFRLMEQRLFQHVVKSIDQARSKCGMQVSALTPSNPLAQT